MGVLSDKFGVPPFSILDSKQGYWQNRKREWLTIGLDSEVGRDARAFNIGEWVEEKEKSGAKTDVSIFDPVLCELSYKWFCKPRGKILDPFAGGSVRGIVASVFGYDYTGVDLRQEQITANFENINKLTIKLPIIPNWVCGDSMNISSVGGKYDLIYSCPPYHDLEKYSEDKNDLSNMDYDKFILNYREIIRQCVTMLNDNSFAVFIVGEIRDKRGFYKNFVQDTVNAFIDAGMKYYNDIILNNVIGTMALRVSKQFEPYRKIGKLHQNVLVFYKGDIKQIKPMDMENNVFKPLTEINIPPITRDYQQLQISNVEPQPEIMSVGVTIFKCDVCGFVAKDQDAFDKHIPRPFHQDQLTRHVE